MNRPRYVWIGSLIIFCAFISTSSACSQSSKRIEWAAYGNDPGGMRYSSLTQINRDNVAKLRVAWVYHTGDISEGTKYPRKSEFESTPIFVDGTLYLTTAFNRVIALDSVSGEEHWTFDPKIDLGVFVSRRPHDPAETPAAVTSLVDTRRWMASDPRRSTLILEAEGQIFESEVKA